MNPTLFTVQRTMWVAFTVVHCGLYRTCHLEWYQFVTVKKATLGVTQLNALRPCVWAIIRLSKPRIKPCIAHHYASDQIVPFFVQYATKSWGEAWERGYIIAQPFSELFWFLRWTQLPSFCFTVQIVTVLKMSFQSDNSLALHQRAIKDAVLVVDKLTFHWKNHTRCL